MTERRDPSKTALTDTLGVSAPGTKGKKRDYTPTGVYLSEAQEALVKKIAAETEQSEYNILKYAVAYFLREYERNPGIIQFEEKKTLKAP